MNNIKIISFSMLISEKLMFFFCSDKVCRSVNKLPACAPIYPVCHWWSLYSHICGYLIALNGTQKECPFIMKFFWLSVKITGNCLKKKKSISLISNSKVSLNNLMDWKEENGQVVRKARQLLIREFGYAFYRVQSTRRWIQLPCAFNGISRSLYSFSVSILTEIVKRFEVPCLLQLLLALQLFSLRVLFCVWKMQWWIRKNRKPVNCHNIK